MRHPVAYRFTFSFLSILTSSFVYAGDVPTKPSDLPEWFSSGAATLAIIMLAVKVLWDQFHKLHEKNIAKKEEDAKAQAEALKKLEQDLIAVKTKHDGCRMKDIMAESKEMTTKLSSDLEKFTDKLSNMAMKWAADMASKEAVITHLRDDVTELKTKIGSVPVEEIQIKLSKLNDKIDAAFKIIDGKRDPR